MGDARTSPNIPWGSQDTTKPVETAEDLLQTLHTRSDQRHEPSNVYYSRQISTAADTRRPQKRRTGARKQAPFLDIVTIKTDHHGGGLDRGAGDHSNLLMQPLVVPDLGHTGLKVNLPRQGSHARQPKLFYPNGTKGRCMSHTISEAFRNSKPFEPEVRESFSRSQSRPKLQCDTHPAQSLMIQTFSQRMAAELELKRPKGSYQDSIAGGISSPKTAPNIARFQSWVASRPGSPKFRPGSQGSVPRDEVEEVLESVRRANLLLGNAIREGSPSQGKKHRPQDGGRPIDHFQDSL